MNVSPCGWSAQRFSDANFFVRCSGESGSPQTQPPQATNTAKLCKTFAKFFKRFSLEKGRQTILNEKLYSKGSPLASLVQTFWWKR